MKFSINKQPIRALLWSGLLGLSLSACSAVGSLGGDSFTLQGELPAGFSLKAQAHYNVSNNCGGRAQAKSFETEFQKDPQHYSFKIPVDYRDGLCEMQLARVGLFVYGRYGEKDWQQTYDNGGLVIVDKLPAGAPVFQSDGTLTKQAECTWLFKLSAARSRFGEVSKILVCKGAGAQLLLNDLERKTLILDFITVAAERPYMNGYWLETENGWKPCTGRWGTKLEELCTAPPKFMPFKMNGNECTVYPNCTE